MSLGVGSSSEAFGEELRSLCLPADPAALAALCGRLFDALRAAEDTVRKVRARQAVCQRAGMALGIVMATHHVDESDAFHVLKRVARRRQLTLGECVEEIVAGARYVGLARQAAMAEQAEPARSG